MKSKLLFTGTAFALAIQLMVINPLAAQNSSLMHAPMPTSPMGPRILGAQAIAAAATMGSAALGPVPRDNPSGAGDVPNDAGNGRLPSASSAIGYGVDRPPVMIDRASWTYQPPPPLRTFQKNDLVTIRVDEITRMMADGAANQRKQTLYETILTDWVKLTDFRLRPDPQDNGDPSIAAESNRNYRAQSSIQSNESLTFNIAATVVDIRPNGSLVLEARKTIRVNDNLWETSLTGICRAQDIAPDNVVLSKDLIDLEIKKEDRGHLRDGYKRGWLSRFLDRVRPF